MTCRIQLTDAEYEIAKLNLRSGNFKMRLCGIDIILLAVTEKTSTERSNQTTYWCEFRRDLK